MYSSFSSLSGGKHVHVPVTIALITLEQRAVF